MIVYEPGETVVHRLDARAKLVAQLGFAVAAFAGPTPERLAGLAAVAALAMAAARLSPLAVVRSYWFVLMILVASPVLAAVSLTDPHVDLGRAVDPAIAASRVALVIAVGAVYVRTTPVRETRVAIQRHVPGRAGRLLGVGVAITFRFVPVLRRDLLTVRDAMRARAGSERSAVDRARRIGVVGLSRALTRAHRLSLALRARCFAWNPTPPAMALSPRDYPVIALGVALALWPLL